MYCYIFYEELKRRHAFSNREIHEGVIFNKIALTTMPKIMKNTNLPIALAISSVTIHVST